MINKIYDKFFKTKIDLYNKELVENQSSEGNIFICIEIEFQGNITDNIIDFIREKILLVADTTSSIFVFESTENVRFILVSLKSIVGKNDELPSIIALTFANAANVNILTSDIIDKDYFHQLLTKRFYFNIENSLRINMLFSIFYKDNANLTNIYDEIVIALHPEVKIDIAFFEQEVWVSKFVPIYIETKNYELLNLIRLFFIKNDYILHGNKIIYNKTNEIYMPLADFIINLENVLLEMKYQYSKQLSRFDLKTRLILLDNNILECWVSSNTRLLPNKNYIK